MNAMGIITRGGNFHEIPRFPKLPPRENYHVYSKCEERKLRCESVAFFHIETVLLNIATSYKEFMSSHLRVMIKYYT